MEITEEQIEIVLREKQCELLKEKSGVFRREREREKGSFLLPSYRRARRLDSPLQREFFGRNLHRLDGPRECASASSSIPSRLLCPTVNGT